MKTIVTHTHPDIDAICSVWLLKRYGGLDNAQVAFVNTGHPDPLVLAAADAVVDTGLCYDPLSLRFDHHQLPGRQANDECATTQVYVYLNRTRDGELSYLQPLIDLVFAVDTGRRTYGASWSRKLGLHGLLDGWYDRTSSSQGNVDSAVTSYGCDLLDNLDAVLQAQDRARRLIHEHLVYRSADSLIWALKDVPEGTDTAAFEAGARLVVFTSQSETPGGLSYAIGVDRAGGYEEPDAGELVNRIVSWNLSPALTEELNSWFRHPAGFFAGRGTRKAPRYDPIRVDLVDVARAIDAAWER